MTLWFVARFNEDAEIQGYMGDVYAEPNYLDRAHALSANVYLSPKPGVVLGLLVFCQTKDGASCFGDLRSFSPDHLQGQQQREYLWLRSRGVYWAQDFVLASQLSVLAVAQDPWNKTFCLISHLVSECLR